jgi:hypothetical protein
MVTYSQAPIRGRPPKGEKSWEERMFEQGYQIGLGNQVISVEAKQVPNSPLMQGFRAGCKELRLRTLLLKHTK